MFVGRLTRSRWDLFIPESPPPLPSPPLHLNSPPPPPPPPPSPMGKLFPGPGFRLPSRVQSVPPLPSPSEFILTQRIELKTMSVGRLTKSPEPHHQCITCPHEEIVSRARLWSACMRTPPLTPPHPFTLTLPSPVSDRQGLSRLTTRTSIPAVPQPLCVLHSADRYYPGPSCGWARAARLGLLLGGGGGGGGGPVAKHAGKGEVLAHSPEWPPLPGGG